MTKLLLALAAGAAGFAAAGAASAQEGYLPPPPYASGPYDYAGVEHHARHGFTLAGARAGITVLGIDLDAHAALDIGVHDPSYGHARRHAYAPRPYAPQPYATGYAPQPEPAYAEPMYAPQPSYAPSYGPPAYEYAPPMGGYGYAQPCGCGG